MLSRRLERSGFSVLVASDGPTALDIVERKPVDLVLLDIMMPGMTGIDVLKVLRATHSAAELPVIMATAKTESDDVVEALGSEPTDYVTKPIDFPVMLARCRPTSARRMLLPGRRRRAPHADAPAPPRPGGPHRPRHDDRRQVPHESPIGSGNFGTVYRAAPPGLDHSVAVRCCSHALRRRWAGPFPPGWHLGLPRPAPERRTWRDSA